jgi:hypothetical protein
LILAAWPVSVLIYHILYWSVDNNFSFGSAINFYGGVGECNHKKFVNSTGFNTQKRIKNFTSQVATRYYEAMTFEIASKCLENKRIDGYMDD